MNHLFKYVFVFSLLLFSFGSFAQKPKNGTYTYTIAFAEWQGKSLGATCTIIIKDDSIKVIHNRKPGLTGKKGKVMDEGIIMKHKNRCMDYRPQ